MLQEDEATPPVGERSIRLAAWTLIAALVLPVIWLLLTRDDHNIGDVALIELRIRDVFSTHPPVTGAYSRYGWSHPGPLMFYLLAAPYRLFGGDAIALRVATLLLNVVALVALFWLARRRGTAPLVAVATATTLLIWGLQPDARSYGWNVTITLVPFVLTVIACWSALLADDRALMVVVVSGVFVFQSHVGVGVVIAPLVLITIGHAVWKRLTPRLDRPGLILGGGLIGLALVPVVFDLLRDPPGNIGRLVRWSLTNDEPKVGLADGLRMIGRTSSLSFPARPELPGRFLLGIETVSTGFLPGAALMMLATALAIARHRGWHDETALCGVVFVLWASGAIAASTITEPLGWWLVEWLQPLGWLTWMAVALVGWRLIQARWAHSVPRLSLGVLAMAGLFVVAASADRARETLRLDDRSAEVVDPVTDLTEAALTAAQGDPIRIDYLGSPLTAETMLSGVANRLDAEGVDICVDSALAYKFGSFRVCRGAADRRLIVRSEPTVEAPPDGTETLVISDPLTEQERIEADDLRAGIADVLERTGRSAQINVLDTPLADTVLLGDPPAELVALTADVRRLDTLREVPGVRYGLYVVTG